MWTRHAARLIETLVAVGAERGAVIADAGITEADLAELDGRVPLEAVYAAIEVALAQTGDPLLGVHLAQRVTLEDLDAMGFLLMTSRTMGEAIGRFARFSSVFVSGEQYHWDLREGGIVAHEFVPYGPDRPAHHQTAELIFYDLARNGPELFGPDLAPIEVRLTHERAQGVDYESLFGVPVRFGQPRYELLFPAALLDVELSNTHPAMAGLIDRYVEDLAAKFGAAEASPPGSATDQILALISSRLEDGPPRVAELAAVLGMSVRSLQRRLQQEGTSLSLLIDRARRAHAEQLVRAGVPIVETAYLLGYSDQASFHRAFRRWTGTTPAQYQGARDVGGLPHAD